MSVDVMTCPTCSIPIAVTIAGKVYDLVPLGGEGVEPQD